MPTGYIYPNEPNYFWGILIVLYPYMTGMLAGVFIISSLAYGFGRKEYKKIAGLALLVSMALIFAPMNPLFELEQPARAWEIFTRPHLIPTYEHPGVSPMAVFSVLYASYSIVLILELLFTFRADLASRYDTTGGLMRFIYKILTFGRLGVDDASVSIDRKIVKTLAIVGIPLAALFHTYVGFLFASIKSRVSWMDPLIPVHFLVSAILSGTALLYVVYYLMVKFSDKYEEPDQNIVSGLGWIMFWSLLISLGLELISHAVRAYYKLPGSGFEYWEMLNSEVLGPVMNIYYALSIIMLIILLIPRFREDKRLLLLASVLILITVFIYRWYVVIGAQLLSRTSEGILEYVPPLFGRISIFTGIGLVSLSIGVFLLLTYIFPWDGEYATHQK